MFYNRTVLCFIIEQWVLWQIVSGHMIEYQVGATSQYHISIAHPKHEVLQFTTMKY